MSEEFYDAAIRHWYDGRILEENMEYDNAVCMQGFAAECALKKIIQVAYPIDVIKKYGHDGDKLLDDICVLLMNDSSMLAALDPALGLRLQDVHLSELLFKNHPERRYYKDGIYSKNDVEACRHDAEKIINEMLRLCIEGYI